MHLYFQNMFKIRPLKWIFCQLLVSYIALFTDVQGQDQNKKPHTIFSGNIGITNNGISIIPAFAFNAPAANFIFSVRKNRFSFDPDIRFASTLTKGGMLFWFRYRFIQDKPFTLSAGVHPALNFMPRQILDNGKPLNVIQARRFMAQELVPSYKISNHFSITLYYLHGNGFQPDGPRNTHFISFIPSINKIHLTQSYMFSLQPSLYYLKLDKTAGTYFAANATLEKDGLPFILQSTINKTIKSNLAGNKDFMWNITLSYIFTKKYNKFIPDETVPLNF